MRLTNAPADVLAQALIDAGGGSSPGGSWPIFVWQEVDSPDNCITLYDTVGTVQGRIQSGGEVIEHPGVQIKVRSSSSALANEKIRHLQYIVDEVIRQTIVHVSDPVGTGTEVSSYLIHAVSRSGTILSLGKEVSATKRTIFTLNVTISLTQLS